VTGSGPRVLASACKILGAKSEGGVFSFHAEGPDGVNAVVCLRLPGPPGSIRIDGQPLPDDAQTREDSTGLVRITFPNKSGGCRVEISMAVDGQKK